MMLYVLSCFKIKFQFSISSSNVLEFDIMYHNHYKIK